MNNIYTLENYARQAARHYLDSDVPLNDSIEKIARDNHLLPEQIKRVTEAANHGVYKEIFTKCAHSDKNFKFPIASSAEILTRLQSDSVKEAEKTASVGRLKIIKDRYVPEESEEKIASDEAVSERVYSDKEASDLFYLVKDLQKLSNEAVKIAKYKIHACVDDASGEYKKLRLDGITHEDIKEASFDTYPSYEKSLNRKIDMILDHFDPLDKIAFEKVSKRESKPQGRSKVNSHGTEHSSERGIGDRENRRGHNKKENDRDEPKDRTKRNHSKFKNRGINKKLRELNSNNSAKNVLSKIVSPNSSRSDSWSRNIDVRFSKRYNPHFDDDIINYKGDQNPQVGNKKVENSLKDVLLENGQDFYEAGRKVEKKVRTPFIIILGDWIGGEEFLRKYESTHNKIRNAASSIHSREIGKTAGIVDDLTNDVMEDIGIKLPDSLERIRKVVDAFGNIKAFVGSMSEAHKVGLPQNSNIGIVG